MDLTALVRTIRSLPPPAFSDGTIGAILRDVRLNDREQGQFPVRQVGYTRNLIYAEPAFQVLVLRWSEAAETLIHDHADQQCWFTAVAGSFDLVNFRRIAGGRAPGYSRIERTQTITGVSVGEPDYRAGEADIHQVTVSNGCAQAISVHVYAKPVTSCLVFDEGRNECALKHLAYDTVLEDRIRLQSA